jgi:hypothetical protein
MKGPSFGGHGVLELTGRAADGGFWLGFTNDAPGLLGLWLLLQVFTERHGGISNPCREKSRPWPGRPEITAAIFGNYNKNESKP